MRTTKLSPRVESMESRELLSAVVAAVAHHVALNGELSGTWLELPTTPDAGTHQTVTASGDVKPLGNVTATGSLHGTGSIASGHAGGTITLSGAKGSVTIQLTGPKQASFGGLPRNLPFQITSGTGIYKGSRDRGTATLTEVLAEVDPAAATIPRPIVGAILGLTLKSK